LLNIDEHTAARGRAGAKRGPAAAPPTAAPRPAEDSSELVQEAAAALRKVLLAAGARGGLDCGSSLFALLTACDSLLNTAVDSSGGHCEEQAALASWAERYVILSEAYLKGIPELVAPSALATAFGS
jgi:hypothetical protein